MSTSLSVSVIYGYFLADGESRGYLDWKAEIPSGDKEPEWLTLLKDDDSDKDTDYLTNYALDKLGLLPGASDDRAWHNIPDFYRKVREAKDKLGVEFSSSYYGDYYQSLFLGVEVAKTWDAAPLEIPDLVSPTGIDDSLKKVLDLMEIVPSQSKASWYAIPEYF